MILHRPDKINHIRLAGFFFLIVLLLATIIPLILRLSGIEVPFSNATRVFVILQILTIPVLSFILGWAEAHKQDDD